MGPSWLGTSTRSPRPQLVVLRPYGDVGSQHTATAARGLLPSHHAVKRTTSLTRAPACHSQFLLHSERSAAISSAVSFRFFFCFVFPRRTTLSTKEAVRWPPSWGRPRPLADRCVTFSCRCSCQCHSREQIVTRSSRRSAHLLMV